MFECLNVAIPLSSSCGLAGVGPHFCIVSPVNKNHGLLSDSCRATCDHISCMLPLTESAADEQKLKPEFCMWLPICIPASMFHVGFSMKVGPQPDEDIAILLFTVGGSCSSKK